MSYFNQQHSQINKYNGLAEGLIEAAMISRHKVSQRDVDESTELSNEEGTTDKAIGDVTAEMMITTPGKIPNEMYYMEDTTVETVIHSHELNGTDMAITPLLTTQKPTNDEFAGHSAIFLSLLIALGVILLLCCSTACFIAKNKRKGSFQSSNDTECDPGCSGANQPLLGKRKRSKLITKASDSSRK